MDSSIWVATMTGLFLPRGVYQLALRDGNLLRRQLHAEIVARHHDSVGDVDLPAVVGVSGIQARWRLIPGEEEAQCGDTIGDVHPAVGVPVSSMRGLSWRTSLAAYFQWVRAILWSPQSPTTLSSGEVPGAAA